MATSGLDGASQTELRHRYQPEMDPEWSESLPYGGKVYLARKKKPDPMYVRVFEVRNLRVSISDVSCKRLMGNIVPHHAPSCPSSHVSI